MQSVQYDPSVLQFHAAELYRRAKWIAWGTALRYGAAAFLIGIAVSIILGREQVFADSSTSTLIVAVIALVGSLIGFDVGTGRAFRFKLQAQQILCQVKIELNTRAASEVKGIATSAGA
ncbi:MAG TPA: hypothetical protein VKY85_17445 [Candidatus Angelobacter sp.]|nr:hypothetical protein [Candidatus Angelobacter sp.]